MVDGATYWAPASVKISHHKAGDKVDITYTEANGKKEVTAVKPAT